MAYFKFGPSYNKGWSCKWQNAQYHVRLKHPVRCISVTTMITLNLKMGKTECLLDVVAILNRADSES